MLVQILLAFQVAGANNVNTDDKFYVKSRQ